jgi:hypothetical protein
MNNGVMHRPKSMRIKEKGFTKSTGMRPLICLQMTLETCYTRHGWFPISWKGIDHSNRFGMVSHKLPDMGWLDLLVSDAMVMMAADDCRG